MRLGLTVFVLAVTVTPGFAADEPAATTTTAGDSISAAKRDFDTIKAARDSALQQKGELPRLSVPELQMTSPTSRLSKMTKEEEAKKKTKSANWLLEAMEKKPEPRKGQERRTADKAEEIRLLLEPQKETAAGGFVVVSAEPTAPVEKDRRAIEPPANPLNQFLTDWMTPQDYALLKPGLQSSNGPGGQLPSNALVSAPSIEASVTFRGHVAGAMTAADRPTLVPSKTAENPYLPAINDPAPPVTFTPPLPPLMPFPSNPPPAIFISPSTPPPPPQSKIPEFAKPAIDDKYFKPLKRF